MRAMAMWTFFTEAASVVWRRERYHTDINTRWTPLAQLRKGRKSAEAEEGGQKEGEVGEEGQRRG